MDSLHKLINSTEKWIEFLPKFPKKLSNWLAKYLWVFTIFGVLTMGFTSISMIVALANPELFKLDLETAYSASMAILLAGYVTETIILIAAVNLLKKGKKLGWEYLFLSVAVNAVVSIAAALFVKESAFMIGWNILSHIASYLISAYLLFQTRSHFVKK